MMTNYVLKLSKNKLTEFLEKIREEYELYAPVCEELTKFSEITDVSEIAMLPNRTDISAKKLFFPPEERIFSWNKNGGYKIKEEKIEEKKKVLFGVRGCDVCAISVLDRYMSGEFDDPYYGTRRKNTIIIGLTCDYPRTSCFCTAFGGMHPSSYDLWLTDIGDCYVVDVGSEIGEYLVRFPIFEEASERDVERKERKIKRIEAEIEKRAKIDLCETKLCSNRIKERAEDKIWTELGERCLSCGKCNFICPTCHCFDIRDITNLDGSEGERVRVWDSCHLYEYARTSAENFRKERHARVRYRIYDKFVFPVMRYGMYACTGCGRCTDICPVGIDIKEVLRGLIS